MLLNLLFARFDREKKI